ncbi:precorrin-6A synthase (deacetylating) [Pseudomonas helleri]|jgi:precorrin-6A synthase|uniref:Precorrin-6A synthase (Deacetylating) n=1 Tax=Pseudomonas helleri TaxID=1608996 RepID=A0A6A7YEH2_9PSED|nr:precorrin-6A synthase (deacetylating) [Pseudomonas helleri]MQT30450.1 precorrin-6A synthase (deacetylating) [Pseudomonas helleri]MQT48009.1 precorrin-6A synthase (deacetylating) [Pseudomonas helleri]MQT90244.1 precorrin-6A synthase (deacetylating) [Pseudomonas helleri]
MKTLLLIGIGAGDPEHITVQAINALNRASVFFVLDKGQATEDLVRLRLEICERYIREPAYRVVQISDPQRDSSTPSYTQGVEDWHEQRAEVFQRLIEDELAEGESGAFLLWGEPGLYDSTLRILERVRANGCTGFDYEVIPGISSVQALAARHRVPLNGIGQPIRITTGRRLTAADLDNVVVMLDAHCAFQRFTQENLDIYWGAYLGTADEILIAGKLADVCEQIKHTREAARQRKGWIMDTYLLRRRLAPDL